MTGRRACLLLSLFGGLVFAVGALNNGSFFHDDAYIALRYARNLAQGDGLVWNAGQFPVEGYTSYLFVVLCAALMGVGVSAETATVAINMASVLLIAWVSKRTVEDLAASNPARSASLLACATAGLAVASFPLAIWTLGGLEAPLYTALSLAGLYPILTTPTQSSHSAASGLMLALATLARPEGIVTVLVSATALALKNKGRGYRPLVAFCTPPFVILGLHQVWRIATYQALLPNTFFAKVSATPDLGNVLSYIAPFLFLPPFVLLLSLFLALKDGARGSLTFASRLLLAVLLSHIACVAAVGGDHMPGMRFWVFPLAVASLLLGSLLSASKSEKRRAELILASTLALSLAQCLAPALTNLHEDPAAFVGRVVGKHIEEKWPMGSLVALNSAGATAFEAQSLYFIDMLGLNDRHIARRTVSSTRLTLQKLPGHRKGDGKYVLSRNPDFIILGPAQGTTANDPWFLSDLELSADRDFHRRYKLVRENLDVQDIPGIEQYPATRRGTLGFTYYKRVVPPGNVSSEPHEGRTPVEARAKR